MPRLRFEGCSDDTFGEYAHTNDDYDNCANGTPIDWLVKAPNGEAVIVRGHYANREDCSWMIGVAAYDRGNDDVPIPKWPMQFVRGVRPYSPALVIDAPDGVELVCLNVATSGEEA